MLQNRLQFQFLTLELKLIVRELDAFIPGIDNYDEKILTCREKLRLTNTCLASNANSTSAPLLSKDNMKRMIKIALIQEAFM